MFKPDEGIISPEEFFEIVRYLDKNLLVGIELERVIQTEPSETADMLNSYFVNYGSCHTPSIVNGYYKRAMTNEYNVAFVTTDASFPSQNEILYSGNIEDYDWNYENLYKLENKLDQLRTMNFHKDTSNHITVLTAYDKLLHPVILKNIMNISRAYSSALFKLTGGYTGSGHLVRPNVLSYANSLSNVKSNDRNISNLIQYSNKYKMFNYSKQSIHRDGGNQYLKGLCIEFRHPDGIRVPSAMAALMMLHKAIVYKAVEFSLHGLVQVTRLAKSWNTNKLITSRMIQQEHHLMPEHHEYMREEAYNLIEHLKPYLKRFGNDRLVNILQKLAQKNVGEHRRQGMSNHAVDSLLHESKKKMNNEEKRLMKMIVAQEINADSMTEWKKIIATDFNCTVRYVEMILSNLSTYTGFMFQFDKKMKTVVFR